MRTGGPRLASEPGTGESRAGGPRPSRVEGPTPAAGLTPAMGSAAAGLPQHRRSRETGCPAPTSPGQPAGSPRRTFHIRIQPYKSRFRRRLPAPYLAIPAPAWGGAQSQAAAGRAPAPRQRERAEAPGRGRAGLQPGQVAQESRGAPGRTRGRRRVFAGRVPPRPHPVWSGRTARLPSVSAEEPSAGGSRSAAPHPRQPRCGVFWVLAARPRQELPTPGKGESPGFQRPSGIALLRPLPTRAAEVCP